MAFKKTLFQRLFSVSRFPKPIMAHKPPLKQSLTPLDQANRSTAPDPGDVGLFKRILQHRPIYHSSIVSSSTMAPGMRSMPTGDKLIEKLRGLDITRDRIRLEEVIPPPTPAMLPEEKEWTVSDLKKLLKASQVETIKAKLREIQQSWLSYPEFVEICKECCHGDKERGAAMARLLDDSSAVVVLDTVVCLRPDQEIKTLVAKAIRGIIPLPVNPRLKELEEMEKHKLEIDRQAELLVQRELRVGLAYLMLQTAAFMRLTFWELSWDVMEPICFYVTSFYFMLGYGFFLRTATEPSFEGFFHSRFTAKQKKLIKASGFDIHSYNQLRKAFHPPHIINNHHHYNSSSSCMPTTTNSNSNSNNSFAL